MHPDRSGPVVRYVRDVPRLVGVVRIQSSRQRQPQQTGLLFFMDNHYTYIIESTTTSLWYYGYTADLTKRLQFHNDGLNTSTKSKGPWKLIFVQPFHSKTEALAFEKYLKNSRNKEYIKRAFKQYFIDLNNGCTPTGRGRYYYIFSP